MWQRTLGSNATVEFFATTAGDAYPVLVRKSEPRPLRVFLQDVAHVGQALQQFDRLLLRHGLERHAGGEIAVDPAFADHLGNAGAAGADGYFNNQLVPRGDLAAEFRRIGLERLQSIHRRKTGALFRASLQLGAIAADALTEERAWLESFGEKLGHAFQVVDDLLDVSGTEAQVGKRLGKDREHGKVTYPALLGETESRAQAARLIEQAVAALAPFGERAHGLRELAEFVGRRSL